MVAMVRQWTVAVTAARTGRTNRFLGGTADDRMSLVTRVQTTAMMTLVDAATRKAFPTKQKGLRVAVAQSSRVINLLNAATQANLELQLARLVVASSTLRTLTVLLLLTCAGIVYVLMLSVCLRAPTPTHLTISIGKGTGMTSMRRRGCQITVTVRPTWTLAASSPPTVSTSILSSWSLPRARSCIKGGPLAGYPSASMI